MKSLGILIFCLCSFVFLAQKPGSGYTLDFNGNSQYVDLNSSFGTLNFPLSVTTWLKFSSNPNGTIRFFSSHDMTGAYRGILFHYLGGGFDLLCGNGVTRGPSGRFGFTAPYTLVPGRWYHVAFVINSPSSAQCYVNGHPITTSLNSTATGNPVLSTDNSTGRLAANTAGSNITYLNGEMDEFTFWDKPLTQMEIRDMMCHKLTGGEANLLAYYRFDNGSGNTLSNLVAGAPAGTLVNNPQWVHSSAPVGDRSSHNSYTANATATLISNSGDVLNILPQTGSTEGTHIYIVDEPPLLIGGITPVGGIDYYFGVFNAEYTKAYDVSVQSGPITSGFNSLKIASRPDNAFPTWSFKTSSGSPNFNLVNESPYAQYIIAREPCPKVNWFSDDTSACQAVTLSVPTGFSNIQWSTGSNSSTISVNNSATVWVTAYDQVNSCTVSDTIDIDIISAPQTNSTSIDTVVCSLASYTHDINVNGALSYLWFDGNTNSSRTFSSSGTYWYTIRFPGGCIKEDTLKLKFGSLSTDPIKDEKLYLCARDTLKLTVDQGQFTQVLWSNGSSSWESEYYSLGVGWVTTRNIDGCWQTDSFEILDQAEKLKSIFNDTSFCAGSSLELEPPTAYNITWPNGSHGKYVVGTSQTIRVEISDGCSELVDYFDVTEYSCECDLKFPNAFTPNGDLLNDVFGPVTKCEFLSFDLRIYNRYGEELFNSYDPNHLFDGKKNGTYLPQGVYLYYLRYSTPNKAGKSRGYFVLVR